MADTYSIAQTGRQADSTFSVANLTLGDSNARLGARQAAMSANTQVLCKNPDGSQTYYTIDAERTTDRDVVLKRV